VDVEYVLPFPDGKRLLLVMDVYPDAKDLQDSARRATREEKDQTDVLAYDALPFRHWDEWDRGKRSHLFVWKEGGGAPIDLLKGLPHHAPPRPFGDLAEVAIAPDGSAVVFTSKMVGRESAWSTNLDIFVAPADGSAPPAALSAANPAQDSGPVFSPDGQTLAWLAMARPGYESDRRRVVVVDWKSRTQRTVAESWDRSPGELSWSRDGKTLFATADNLGRHALFAIDAASGEVKTVRDSGHAAAPRDLGDRLLFLQDSLTQPVEIWTARRDGGDARAVTHLNDDRVAAIDWGQPEQLTFRGAKGDMVYAWMIKPPSLKEGARVPVAFLIHGGPQGSFGDHFHYRWNGQAYAGRGYATVMIDFHGSTGYGQAFTDSIRGDWGGAPYEDVMKGVDEVLARYRFADGGRMVALGASYGGFLVNWINGQTDRFKALVCHDGNLDEVTAYYMTEELWFPEWEHGGVPWESPQGYTKHNPMAHVAKWKTPTLVIHGGRDYRVVDTQGMGTFTALQRRGVPSRFLYFPDENHWVLKPLHSKRWHEEVLSWIDRHAK
jgi:dipeptidyl aminopeptidase/acylaminoacyl peptidase